MTRRITLAIAGALAALLLGAGLAAGQEPDEAGGGTRLEPGANLVGWVGEARPVSELFREIPRLEGIWAWDAELRDWIVAAPGAPEWLGGLGRVTAGMGLRMQLGGDQPFLWQRSTEPTRGLVKLRTGWNLVAWSGADGAAIGDVAKGIGWSLRTVRRWDAANQEWVTWTSPERSAQVIANTGADQGDAGDEAQPVGIRRGEALWIEVARAVNWLQPTEILPRLVFPGGASQELQSRVREDLRATLAFFRDQYGIQADPDFTVYAAKDIDALIQAYKDDGQDVDEAYEASERALWNRAGGWGGSKVVVKQSHWPEDLSTDEISWVRYTVTHEYFHVMQWQLGDGSANTWLTEGTASWVDHEHKVLDEERTWDDLRDSRSSAINGDTPTLRSTESPNATWEYRLGWLATDQLTQKTALDFPVEFWRALASTEIGPHRRWKSTPDWRIVFQGVFGQPVSEFYEDFDAWQREEAAANPSTGGTYEGNWIRGRVADEHGASVAGVFVDAIRVEGETGVDWNQRAETAADGTFAVRAPEGGDYRLSVKINDSCRRYYNDGELINDRADAQPIAVDGRDIDGIDVQLPPNVCGWQIRGRVVGPSGKPLAGIPVTGSSAGGGYSYSATSTADGSFAVTANESGEYRISADLADGCSVYFRSGSPTTDWNNASLITVGGAHVSDILIQAPKDLCRLRVAGSLDGIERFLGGYLSAQICRLVDNRCESSMSRRLEDDGPFAVAIPDSGTHRLTYNLDGCSVHYGPTGLTANAAGATLINVDSRDVRVGHRQVPANVCAHSISGALIDSDGQPLADTYVSACLEEDGDCVSWTGRNTDDDGAFAITVPIEGDYRLSFNLEGCTIYFRAGGLTTTFSERGTARVQGRDARLNPRQIPTSVCAYQIKGSITKSDGQPLADAWVSACVEVDGVCVIWRQSKTGNDGAFAITVPEEGMYYASFSFEGCSVYFRAGGLTATRSERSTVRVEGRDLRLGHRQIPNGMCQHRISGRFVDSNGAPLSEKQINAFGPGGSGGVSTDPDGRFEIRVPSDGAYSFGVELRSQPYCWHSLAGQALGSPNNPVRVSGADVTSVVLRLSGTIEELCE